MTDGAIIGLILGLFFLIILMIFLAIGIKVVKETDFLIIERFGKYRTTLQKGINFIIPLIDKIRIKDNTKEKVFDFPAQQVITKDNATILVDTVVYLKIQDPKLFAYGAEKPIVAIRNLTSTTLRNLIGELELDQSLTSRDTINSKLTAILDRASDPWGIKVNRIELQNIMPPKEVQEAMIRQMQAERDRRAKILEAEGIRESEILKAQGYKESLILKAEANKRKIILEAEAIKEQLTLEAEGKKSALELLNQSPINESILQLKAIEQLGTLANGNATKIILPPNLKDVASSMAVAQAMIEKEK